MIRIGVCDDVSCCVETLASFVMDWAEMRKINVKLEKFKSGEEVLLNLEARGDFAAVFMDIELDGINGMETALKLRKADRLVSIVFVSGHEQYFKKLFQVYPFQFVEKPVAKQKIYEVLDKIAREQTFYNESFYFQYKWATFHINLKQVLYFASEGRIVRILMEDGREHVFYEKLDELEEKLAGCNHRFMRIHKSYLVNERQIEQYRYKNIVMRNGDVLTVSREKRSLIGRHHMNLLSEKC